MNTRKLLITGCSSGIGYETAKYLNQFPEFHVLASCRKETDVIRLNAAGLDCIQLDVDKTDSIQSGFNKVIQHFDGKLDILINNAAYAEAGALEDLTRSQLRLQFETNVFGLMELSNLAIPLMRKQGSGTLLNIGSILGHVAGPYKGAYNASKFAVEGLTDTLRLELEGSGIRVLILDPGPVVTKFRDNAQRVFEKTLANKAKDSVHQAHYQKRLANLNQKKLALSVSGLDVAKKIHRILINPRPKARYFITIPAHVMAFAKRILPTALLDKLLAKII